MSNEVENKKRSSTPDLLDSGGANAVNEANENEPTNENDNISELSHIVELENSIQNIKKDNESLASKTQTNNCQYKVTCTVIKSSFTKQQEPFEFTLNSDCNEITAILHSIKTTTTSSIVGLNDKMTSQQDRPPSGLASALSSPQSNRSDEALNCEKNPESSIVKLILEELQTTSQGRQLLQNNVNSQAMSDSKAQDSEKAGNVYIEIDKREKGFRLTIHMSTSPPAQTSAKSGDNVKPQQCSNTPDSSLLHIDLETVPEIDPPTAIKSFEENKNERTNQEAGNEPESDNSSNESNGN